MEENNDVHSLRFVYCNTSGEVSDRHLVNWSEAGHYIKGFCAAKQRVLTFRKDRIQSFFDGHEQRVSVCETSPPPRPRRDAPPDGRPQICFTGFAKLLRASLEEQADASGLRVMQTVTSKLVFLCAGPNAGPAKLEKSRSQGVYIITQIQLSELLETGVLPDDAVDALGDAQALPLNP